MIKTYIHRGMCPVALPGVYVQPGDTFSVEESAAEAFNRQFPNSFEEVPAPPAKNAERQADTEEAKP